MIPLYLKVGPGSWMEAMGSEIFPKCVINLGIMKFVSKYWLEYVDLIEFVADSKEFECLILIISEV